MMKEIRYCLLFLSLFLSGCLTGRTVVSYDYREHDGKIVCFQTNYQERGDRREVDTIPGKIVYGKTEMLSHAGR